MSGNTIVDDLRPRAERELPLHTLLRQLISIAPTEAGTPGETLALNPRREFDRGYTAAVLHMLERLGAVTADRELLTAAVPSPQSGYLLRQLLELLSRSEPLVAGEQSAETLAALERLRLLHNPGAHALRRPVAALGLIVSRNERGEPALLLVHDRVDGETQLPGGRYELQDGSLEATLRRELTEELGCGRLLTEADVSLDPVGQWFELERLSPTAGLLTRTTFQVFAVRFTDGRPDMREGMRWVTLDEVHAALTGDGGGLPEPLLALTRQRGVSLDALPLAWDA
jgi:8-oxo-dGTP pyrophosphatase MutT (NUDIX family)